MIQPETFTDASIKGAPVKTGILPFIQDPAFSMTKQSKKIPDKLFLHLKTVEGKNNFIWK